MLIRLFPVSLLLLVLAGCGGPSGEPDGRGGQARAREAADSTERHRNPSANESAEAADRADGPGKTPSRETEDEPVVEAEDATLRKWTDTSGRILVAGEFVSLLDGNVCLQKASGEGTVIALDQLSQADQDYVRSLAPEPASDPVRQEALSAADEAAAEESSAEPPAEARQEYRVPGRRKVVVPFDFVSKFDGGRYGQMVGEMIWKKLEREGGFVIDESMYDIRDLCAARGRKITPETPLEEVAKVVRNDFEADIGIWGSVERAPGHEWDVYDLTIKCVDFTAGPEPKVIYEKTGVRTQVVSEIPHLYVKEMLDKLYGRKPGGPPPVDQLAEENWKNNPNLVAGGDFQRGMGGVPVGWESRGGQHREPLGNLVKWIAETGSSGNKVIRFTFDEGVGNGYGVMYYSKPFPVDEGAKYRFQCRWRSNGPNAKVFIKCYDEMASQYRPGSSPTSGTRAGGRGSYAAETTEPREGYRSQMDMKGPKNTWNVHVEDFTPEHTRYTPRWGRVMLYAYLGAGVVEFDDIVLKQIVPASPSESKKDRRHSMESGVTLKEMEQNERRGREAAERLRQRRAEER